jgi:hypothetical protein
VKIYSARIILSGLLGFALLAMPVRASAVEPIGAIVPAQYMGEPAPPYYGPPPNLYAEHQRLVEQLHYAESQYRAARASGERKLAKHWAKEVKRLKHSLAALDRDVERHAYTPPPYMTPPVPAYPSAYAPPTAPYPLPAPTYDSQYPATEAPAPYPAYPPAAYPPSPGPGGYASAPSGDPLSAIVSSLVGPMFGSTGIH